MATVMHNQLCFLLMEHLPLMEAVDVLVGLSQTCTTYQREAKAQLERAVPPLRDKRNGTLLLLMEAHQTLEKEELLQELCKRGWPRAASILRSHPTIIAGLLRGANYTLFALLKATPVDRLAPPDWLRDAPNALPGGFFDDNAPERDWGHYARFCTHLVAFLVKRDCLSHQEAAEWLFAHFDPNHLPNFFLVEEDWIRESSTYEWVRVRIGQVTVGHCRSLIE